PVTRRGRKGAPSDDDQAAKKKRTRSAASKTGSKKKSKSKKPAKKSAPASEESVEGYPDAEARIGEAQSRAEFATRRGGRRRRRSGKAKPTAEAGVSDDAKVGANGADEEIETLPIVEIPEEIVTAPAAPPEVPSRQPSREREQRSSRDRGYRGNQSRRDLHQPAITDLLSEGQEILVQIAKEPIAKKGARITSHIALPGRFLVYMPTVEHVGVSRKIESDNERHRLRKLIQT